MKLNVDASVVNGASSFSVGMLVRDDRGAFILGKTMRFEGTVPVFEAEAIGVNEALSWIRSLQLQQVTIETDSFLTVKALEGNYHNYLEVGNWIESCRLKLQDRGDISIKYVRKNANMAAHLMARIPCLVNCYNVMLSPPLHMLETLMYDSVSS